MKSSHYQMDPFSKQMIPFYSELKDYKWVDDFLKCQSLHKQFKQLGEAQKQLRHTHSNKEAFRARLKKSFDDYRARRKNHLQRFLRATERSKNPFARLETGSNPIMQRVLAPVTWDDIEDALNDLEGLEDGLSDEEREKQLSAITTEVENIKSKLAKLNKPEFFQMHNGQIDCDIREIFFKWWLYVQNLCNQPCNPRGFNLDSSLPLEIEAYHKLGIDRAVNKKRPEGPAEG